MNILKKIIYIMIVLVLLSTAACTPPISLDPTLVPTSSELPTNVPTLVPTEAEIQSSPSDGVERITIDELNTLLDGNKSVVIIDARARVSFDMGHIQGAISLPWKPELTVDDLEMIPSGDSIVTYCDCGPGEADGADVARQLMKLGFENVKTLAHPSIEGWIELGYPIQ